MCGDCFYSPGYYEGSNYGNYDACVISPLQSGWLDVMEFDIEYHSSCSWDRFNVGGSLYCGTDGPQGVPVTTSSSITFYADAFVTDVGAHICLTQASPAPTPPPPPTSLPTPAPTMTCDTATGFSIVTGGCTACGACFHTPNYLTGEDYDDHHDCTISVLQDGWLDVLEFEIED